MKTVPPEDYYTALDCPDYGPVSVVKQIPLVSYKSYCESKNDNRSAFISMIMECTNLKETTAGTFTERDSDHIGRHLAGSLAARDVYDDARKSGKSPAEAFAAVSKAMPYPSVAADQIKHITGRRFRIGEYARMGLVTPAAWSNHKVLLNATAQAASLIQPIGPPAFPLPRFGANLDAGSLTKMGQMDMSKALRDQLTTGIAAMPDLSRQWEEYQKQVLAPAANAINGVMRDVIKPFTQGIARDFGVRAGSPLLAQMDNYCKDMLTPLRQHLDGLSRLGSRLALSMVKMNGILSMPKLQSSLKIAQDFVDNVQTTLKTVHQAITATNDFYSTSLTSISSLAGYGGALRGKLGGEVEREEEIVPSAIRIAHDGDLRICRNGGLVIVKKTELIQSIENELEKAFDKKFSEKIRPYRTFLERAEKLSQSGGFLECLQTFAQTVSDADWDVFWERTGETFIHRPEQMARTQLGLYLKGRFEGVAFVCYELRSGAGYLDVVVNFLGIYYIVELKIVGPKWSISRAEDGLPQLDRYMESHHVDESYLVVFDGRKTSKGRALERQYSMEHGTIHVVPVKIFWVPA